MMKSRETKEITLHSCVPSVILNDILGACGDGNLPFEQTDELSPGSPLSVPLS